MTGLFALSAGGLGFLFLAVLEFLSVSAAAASSSSSAPALLPAPLLLRLRFLCALLLSSSSLLSSLVSTLASSSTDPFCPSLPLSSLAAVSPFLLYSVAGLLSLPSSSSSLLFVPFSPSLLDLLLFFSFGQEFLLFYLRRKDIDGVENRYFDLLLIPILVCAVSTLLAIARPRSLSPRIARAAGLALHGTWFIQMAFSFFTSLIAYGCSLHQRSGADYTIKCKTHEDYHRGRAIATLQFNCHMALLVVAGTALYGAMAGRMGVAPGYRHLNTELQMGDVSPSNFTLDSDEEEIAVKDQNVDRKHNDFVLPIVDVGNANGSH